MMLLTNMLWFSELSDASLRYCLANYQCGIKSVLVFQCTSSFRILASIWDYLRVYGKSTGQQRIFQRDQRRSEIRSNIML